MTQLPDLATYPWRYRRALVFATLAVCALGVSYLTLFGADSRLNETLAFGYFGLWGATLGSYVFGAVWHDTSLMNRPRRRRVPSDFEAGPPITTPHDQPDDDDR